MRLGLLKWLKKKLQKKRDPIESPQPSHDPIKLSQSSKDPLLEALRQVRQEREERREEQWRRRRIRWNLEIARKRPEPKPSSKFFKPRTAHEKRLFKPNEKPEEDD